MEQTCREIIRLGKWSYTVSETSFKEIDVDKDSTMSPGDMTLFDSAKLNVLHRRDGSLFSTGSLFGTCTVLPEESENQELCALTFDFGAAGTVLTNGSLEEVGLAFFF